MSSDAQQMLAVVAAVDAALQAGDGSSDLNDNYRPIDLDLLALIAAEPFNADRVLEGLIGRANQD